MCHIFAEKSYKERVQVMRKAQLCHNFTPLWQTGCRLFINFGPLTCGDMYLPSSTQQMKLVKVLQCKTWSTTHKWLNGQMFLHKSLGQAISQMFKTNCQITTRNWNLMFSLTAKRYHTAQMQILSQAWFSTIRRGKHRRELWPGCWDLNHGLLLDKAKNQSM